MELFINNRRYIGSKKSLLNQIYDVVLEYYPNNERLVFADIFGGTGVVSEFFANQRFDIIVNDFLYSNFLAYETWLSNDEINVNKMKDIINNFNDIKSSEISENYFSKIYAHKYFHKNDAKKIGFIREEIDSIKGEITSREYAYLLTSLLYATDKIANTVGHFEHYLSKEPIERGVVLRKPYITDRDVKFDRYNIDSNRLVREISCDIAYIDPPYNARQYVNFYHVLENLARWKKPKEFEGKSMKFKRDHLKSEYSRVKAPIVFKDLIDNLDAKLIIVSYNNTYKANSTASNNKISEEEMFNILSNKGRVRIVEIDYKSFQSGKTNFKDHKEFIYICEVD
jgi:adenine-specific DNA-methyltransferase